MAKSRSDKMLRKAARRVLYFRREGKATDEDARAARLVFQGRATAAEEDRVLAFMPAGFSMKKKRASQARREFMQYSQMVRGGLNISRDVGMAMGEDATALTSVATKTGDVILKNRRALYKLSEGVAKKIGSDPGIAKKLVTGLVRFSRFLGPIATAIGVGAAAAMSFFRTEERGAKARKEMAQDVSTAQAADRKALEQYQRQAMEQVKSESMFFYTGDADYGAYGTLFGQWQYNRKSAEAQEVSRKNAERMFKHRKLMFERYQMKRKINQMRKRGYDEYEIRRFMNEEAVKDLTPTDAEVQARMASRYYALSADPTWWNPFGGWQRGYAQMKYALIPGALEAEREAARQEILDQRVKNEENYQKRMQRLQEQRQMKYDAKEELEMQMAADENLAEFNGYRSRHKMVNID